MRIARLKRSASLVIGSDFSFTGPGSSVRPGSSVSPGSLDSGLRSAVIVDSLFGDVGEDFGEDFGEDGGEDAGDVTAEPSCMPRPGSVGEGQDRSRSIGVPKAPWRDKKRYCVHLGPPVGYPTFDIRHLRPVRG